MELASYSCEDAVPLCKSIFLNLAKPIFPLVGSVPSLEIVESHSVTSLKGVIVASPVSLPNSGNECTFVILNLFPILTGVFVLSNDTVDLALLIDIGVVPILSISYPFTYALPGDTCMTNLSTSPPFVAV